MSNVSSLQLCLINNDPISTLLVTPDGEPMFSIETPLVTGEIMTPTSATRDHQSPRRQKSSTTTITRLERHTRSTGNVETTIGVVEYQGADTGTSLQLCLDHHELEVTPMSLTARIASQSKLDGEDDESDDGTLENSWEFTGPDQQNYKWQMFIHSPMLMLAGTPFTPLARYRRAKIGIVSRSRKAFLEILPAGINIIDLIVVTFVAFMKQRLLMDGTPSTQPETSLGASGAEPTLMPPAPTKCSEFPSIPLPINHGAT